MTQANNVAIESSQINSSGVLQVAGGGTGVTTSTGTGALVLNTSPTLTTPLINQINTSVTNTSLGAGNASIMKNRIINGAMVIDQRNAGASVTATTGQLYSVDRWQMFASANSKYTAQQSSTAPTGFSNSVLITSSSAYSVSSSDYFFFSQKIEGFNTSDLSFGTAQAKTITLSFQVYSSLTGTFGGSLMNSALNRSYPFTYSIPVANTWTSISVTIAGDTTGTWIGSTNGIGMYVSLGLGCGSATSATAGSWASGFYPSATGATSVVGTNGATFYITGVQLEVGSSATGFEYRQYQQELALCQRYYETSYPIGSPPGTASLAGVFSSQNTGAVTTGFMGGYASFKVIKRATPSMSVYDTAGTINASTRLTLGTTTNAGQPGSADQISTVGFDFFSANGTSNSGMIIQFTANSEL